MTTTTATISYDDDAESPVGAIIARVTGIPSKNLLRDFSLEPLSGGKFALKAHTMHVIDNDDALEIIDALADKIEYVDPKTAPPSGGQAKWKAIERDGTNKVALVTYEGVIHTLLPTRYGTKARAQEEARARNEAEGRK